MSLAGAKSRRWRMKGVGKLGRPTFDQTVPLGFSERFQHGSHDHRIEKSQEFEVHLWAEGVKGWEKGEAYLRDDSGIVSIHMQKVPGGIKRQGL